MLNDEIRRLARFIQSGEASLRKAAERFLARKRASGTSEEGYGNAGERSIPPPPSQASVPPHETPQCDGKWAAAFLEGIAALRSLGCQKHEAEVLMRRAMYENPGAELPALLAAALRNRRTR